MQAFTLDLKLIIQIFTPVLIVGIAWGDMRRRVNSIEKKHDELKEILKAKQDKENCDDKHDLALLRHEEDRKNVS